MSGVLEQIEGPADVGRLSVEKLKELAEELRAFIIETVSKRGGHLGSSLGAVELTLALHYVFDFSRDRLIWDVGHQCYSHKIITGRRADFDKLRTSEGPSGFPNPAESSYDQFAVGHAGTSVATAIGLALGAKLRDSDEKIVAFVGDASIVNGTNFEALNNLSIVKRQLLIVLNDNSMAIDATVGALAKYFSKIRLSHTYEDLRKTTKSILDHMPVIGKGMDEVIERIKKSIRMALPASQIFESLNIPYFGPVDGHDIESLIKLFKALGELNRPAILHVYTRKGKGFTPAEEHRLKMHSTGPFEINGEAIEPPTVSKGRSFTDAFGDAITAIAEKDQEVVAITSAMCEGTGLAGFRSRFSDRFYDVGIAESAAVDVAAGLAKSGLKPVVCIYSTFLQRSFDQIFQEVALQNLPVVFCIDRAGLVGSDGPTHHGVMDIGFLRMMPNVVLVAPVCESELISALDFAVGSNRCVAIRYPKDAVVGQRQEPRACRGPFELGKGVIVRESAPDKSGEVTIVSYGPLLFEAIKAADILAGDGIEIDLINARFAVPVDEKIVSLGAEGRSIITIEDHNRACGFGSALLEGIFARAGRNQNINIRTLGVGAKFVRHASRAEQLMELGLSADSIVEAVKKMLSERHQRDYVES
jgi:1-deoxy-D-xylulose-5-phosphate synthase